MDLYKNLKNKIENINSISFNSEKEIQTLVEQNSVQFFNLQFIGSEVKVGSYRIDSLCFDKDNKSFVIIEYKKGNSYSVIDQGFTYLQLLLNNKAEFLHIYSEHLDKVIKNKDIDWSQSKILFVSQSFNTYQKDSVNFKGLPFELWEILKYENNLVSLNQIQTTSSESINSITSANSEKIKSVNKEIVNYDEEYHTKKFSKDLLANWEKLKDQLLSEENVNIKFSSSYISFTVGNTRKTIAYFNTRAEGFKVHILRGFLREDGSESKKLLRLDDPKKLAKEITWKYLNDTQLAYEIIFDKNTNSDYLLFLIKQQIKKISS